MFFSPARMNRAVLNGYGYAPSAWARSDTLDRLFADALDGINHRGQVESDETSITLTLDVPGLSKEQLTIGIEGRVLHISSKDDAPRSLKAVYKLGSDVDAGKSEAKLEHGVLTLKLTKLAPESRQVLLPIN